ncbi:hypothetical protein [Borrelia sp. RT1S]|uniref:hypothetical protein n=1 Tax=Borrelia sp. RT1S TaxID=2898580 RepID=UPI001E5FB180|nr:hypothetical protein [Borrelia sp. RT1S]UGQ17925.1 hypothetical protein LSO05_05695 [Borrelia sp. RT1S]
MNIIKSVNRILDAAAQQQAIVDKLGGAAGVVLAKQGLDITNAVINFVTSVRDHIERTNQREALQRIEGKLQAAVDIADKAAASLHSDGDWEAYDKLIKERGRAGEQAMQRLEEEDA